MSYRYAGRFGVEGIIDVAGNAQTAASVLVRVGGTGTSATLYADHTKAATASNPVALDSDGNVSFYVDPGEYDLVITVGAATRTKRVVVSPSPYETPRVVSALAAGAKGDGQHVTTGGGISSGAAALTIGSSLFAAGDVGKRVVVNGAGAAGVPLNTTILAYVSPTQVTLAANASTTVSNIGVAWGTDDTAAVQAAITALPITGGAIDFGAGHYFFNSSLDVEGKISVTLRGAGGMSAGVTPTTRFSFTGTGSTYFINARRSYAFKLERIQVLQTNSGFTGVLVDLSNPAGFGGNDAFFGVVLDCYLGSLTGLRTAIGCSVQFSSQMTFTRSTFADFTIGIKGRNAASDYSNIIKIDRVNFINQSTAHIYNPGEAWHVVNCNFQPLASGAAGSVDHVATSLVKGFVYHGNWHGDLTDDSGAQVTIAGNGISIKGCSFGIRGGKGVEIDEATVGVDISGNVFDASTVGGSTAIVYTGGAGGLKNYNFDPNAYINSAGRGQGNRRDMRVTGAGLNATDFATAGLSLVADSTATIDEGPSIIFGGETGNGVTPYPYGYLRATKDSSTAGNYTAGFRFGSMTSAGGATQFLRGTGDGSAILGKGAAATNATEGFLYIPTCAGTPTGTPATQTGFVPIIYDTTNDKLYIYRGGWKGGTAPGAWS